jgi:hypothetical protein
MIGNDLEESVVGYFSVLSQHFQKREKVGDFGQSTGLRAASVQDTNQLCWSLHVYRNFRKYFVNTWGYDKTVRPTAYRVVSWLSQSFRADVIGQGHFHSQSIALIFIVPYTLWLHVTTAAGKDCLNWPRTSAPYLGLFHGLNLIQMTTYSVRILWAMPRMSELGQSGKTL